MTGELELLPALSGQVARGALSARELVEECLERIAEGDREIEAWRYVAAAEALEAAREAGARPRSALEGIPFGVKDIFDTAGMPTEWGTPLARGRIPEADCALVAELKRLGGIVLGKTHTTAFAHFDPGPTRNPHGPGHTPGGSSSGSAAAVAAGMVPFALGSQTLGSVIRPASFCGVTGFKPSYGLLSLAGVLPLSRSLDHAGFFTRTAEEMAFLWEALRGERAEPRLERLTALKWPLEGKLELAMEQGFEECLERLRPGGIALDWAAAPQSFEELPRAVLTVEAYEAARLHRELYAEHGEALGRKLAELFEAGLALSESEYVAAKNALATARQEYEAWSKEHPVTATPAALGAAPAGLESTGDPRANAPWTALGAPALTVPFGRDDEGLPLGLQLTAPAGRDGSVLGAGLVCERVLGRLR